MKQFVLDLLSYNKLCVLNIEEKKYLVNSFIFALDVISLFSMAFPYITICV